MTRVLEFLKRALRTELKTDAGRVNCLGGILSLILLIVSYVPVTLDYIKAGLVIVYRPDAPVPEISQTPPWAILTFVGYFVLCVGYVGIKDDRSRRARASSGRSKKNNRDDNSSVA